LAKLKNESNEMVKDKEVLEEKIKKINEEFGFFKN
jgi:hypothetical protein